MTEEEAARKELGKLLRSKRDPVLDQLARIFEGHDEAMKIELVQKSPPHRRTDNGLRDLVIAERVLAAEKEAQATGAKFNRSKAFRDVQTWLAGAGVNLSLKAISSVWDKQKRLAKASAEIAEKADP